MDRMDSAPSEPPTVVPPAKGLSGSAVAYEITDAAAQAETIGLTELGRRAVSPTEEGDDVVAMREAFLRPRIIREFLERYDGSTLPIDELYRAERARVVGRADEPSR
jgi:hypothetical protein